MYSMKETCDKTNMSYETLKYYCNEGLVPNVKRDKNNYKIFDDNDIGWINSLNCLKRCGMSIKDMKTYTKLCLGGKTTIIKRKEILKKQKQDLLKQVKTLNDCIDYIDKKQKLYDDILNGKTKYKSYLIKDE